MKDLADEIMDIMASGNDFDERNKKTEALALYQQAWDLLPEPKLEWTPLSSWVTGSFFNLHFDNGDFKASEQWAQRTLDGRESDIDTGPLINVGMVFLELGKNAQAYKYFDEAYRFGKARAFQERPKKYLNFYLDEKKKPLIVSSTKMDTQPSRRAHFLYPHLPSRRYRY